MKCVETLQGQTPVSAFRANPQEDACKHPARLEQRNRGVNQIESQGGVAPPPRAGRAFCDQCILQLLKREKSTAMSTCDAWKIAMRWGWMGPGDFPTFVVVVAFCTLHLHGCVAPLRGRAFGVPVWILPPVALRVLDVSTPLVHFLPIAQRTSTKSIDVSTHSLGAHAKKGRKCGLPRQVGGAVITGPQIVSWTVFGCFGRGGCG